MYFELPEECSREEFKDVIMYRGIMILKFELIM